MIIYKVTNKVNGNIYIGKTTQSLKRRKQQHMLSVVKGDNRHFPNAINKYGEDNFEWEIVYQIPKEYSINFLNTLEKYTIIKYRFLYNKKLYNMTDGGEGLSGYIRSEETLKKLSDSHKGKPSPNKGKIFSEEARKNMSIAHKGQIAWNKGIPRSEETKKKLSEANKGKPSPTKGKILTKEQREKIGKRDYSNQSGENSVFAGTSLFKIWVDKYGLEGALLREEQRKERCKATKRANKKIDKTDTLVI